MRAPYAGLVADQWPCLPWRELKRFKLALKL